MDKRPLGNTGLQLSALGLGTVKFGRNQAVKYPKAFELPDENTCANLLGLAKDLGINVLDTAPAYGESEARLGRLLKGHREDWVLVSKAGESFQDGVSSFCFEPEMIIQSVEESLRRLNTEVIDVMLIHSDGNDEEIIRMGALDALAECKQRGLIRATGMSTKTISGGLMCVEKADVVMMTYRPDYLDEIEVLKAAKAKQKGVLIKKAFASGHLSQFDYKHPVEEIMTFILQELAVTSVICGTITPQHLKQNVQAVCQTYRPAGGE